MTQDTPDALPHARAVLIQNDAGSLGLHGSDAHAALGQINGDLPGALASIAASRGEIAEVRFKAYEALHALGRGPDSDAEKQAAVGVYLKALRDGPVHDAFGFPGRSPSGAGKRVVGFGTIALRQLLALSDDGSRLVYDGSEEPTLAALRGYRIKDLVGVWLGAMTRTPVDVEADAPVIRDCSIARAVAAARQLIH